MWLYVLVVVAVFQHNNKAVLDKIQQRYLLSSSFKVLAFLTFVSTMFAYTVIDMHLLLRPDSDFLCKIKDS